jgi:hypothetical protein
MGLTAAQALVQIAKGSSNSQMSSLATVRTRYLVLATC